MMPFRPAYPSSFLKLLLIGFALIMLPLLFAFGNAALSLDRLAEQSRKTVYHAVEATRASRSLAEQLTVMERSTRQFLVLGDATLLDHYRIAHERFGKTVNVLQQLPLDSSQRRQLAELGEKEVVLSGRIDSGIDVGDAADIVAEFNALSDLAQAILEANNQLIDRESAILAASAEQAQHTLLWQTLPLLPLALLAALLIAYLLARPIRRMDSAISRLGRGEYNETIRIDGPGDLRTLGERLDWLRIQLANLEEQKKRFLRHVSHELKTPLTAIREGSELLAEEVGGTLTPSQQEITAILRDNSLRLQKMIENLLNYTEVQFQKPALKVARLALRPLLEEALSAHALTISAKRISTIPALAEVTVQGDGEKLLTVMDNLLSNAIKFTPRDGTITVRLAQEGKNAIIEVSDSGPGIAASDRGRLFEPFYRGGGIYDGRVAGSGLGLSIAREYVEAHHGSIALMPSGHGACFRVTLPVSIEGLS